VSILLDDALQHFSWCWETSFFIKIMIYCGNEDGAEYSNSSKTEMRFNLSSPLSMGNITGKYMEVGDGEGKTCRHPSLPH